MVLSSLDNWLKDKSNVTSPVSPENVCIEMRWLEIEFRDKLRTLSWDRPENRSEVMRVRELFWRNNFSRLTLVLKTVGGRADNWLLDRSISLSSGMFTRASSRRIDNLFPDRFILSNAGAWLRSSPLSEETKLFVQLSDGDLAA